MRSAAILLMATGLVTGLGVVSAAAQRTPKPPKPKTDAELIANAMSAAPAAVSKDATVVVMVGLSVFAGAALVMEGRGCANSDDGRVREVVRSSL